MPYFKYLFSLIVLAILYIGTGHTADAAEDEVFHPSHHLNLKFSPLDAVTKLGVQCLTAEGDHAEAVPSKINNGVFLKVGGSKYISDQGALGSCTSHACQYAILGVHEDDFLLSRLGLYRAALTFEGSNSDTGVSLYSDFMVLTGAAAPYGYFPEHMWDYDDRMGWNPKFLQEPPISAKEVAKKHQVVGNTGLAWVGPDLHRIQVALANGYFLPFGMRLNNSFMKTRRDGRVPPVRGRSRGGHAMCFIGYDNALINIDGSFGALRFRNSWGAHWGQDGDGFLPYNQLHKVAEVWAVRGVTGQAEAAEAPKFGLGFRAPTEDDVITYPEDDV